MANEGKIIIRETGFVSPDKEEFKRPDHPDFKDSSELKAMNFCGVRINSLSHHQELWIMGEVKLSMSLAGWHQPSWDKAMSEVLGLHEVETLSIDNFQGRK